MSAWELSATHPSAKSTGEGRPRLRGLPAPSVRAIARVPFAGLMILLLAVGMAGLLVFNTYLQDQAFQLRRAQTQAAALGDRLSDVEAQVNEAEAPAQLAGRATELGMVPNPNAVYVDLATGRIVGEPKAVTGNEIPSLRVQPTGATTAVPQPTEQIDSAVQPWFNVGATPAGAKSSQATTNAKAGTAKAGSAASTKAKPASGAKTTKPAATKSTPAQAGSTNR